MIYIDDIFTLLSSDLFDPVGLSLFLGISIVSSGDLSLWSGDDNEPPISSNLLVELLFIVGGWVDSCGGCTFVVVTVVAVETAFAITLFADVNSGVLGNNEPKPCRTNEPEFKVDVCWTFGENFDNDVESNERGLRVSHQVLIYIIYD